MWAALTIIILLAQHLYYFFVINLVAWSIEFVQTANGICATQRFLLEHISCLVRSQRINPLSNPVSQINIQSRNMLTFKGLQLECEPTQLKFITLLSHFKPLSHGANQYIESWQYCSSYCSSCYFMFSPPPTLTISLGQSLCACLPQKHRVILMTFWCYFQQQKLWSKILVVKIFDDQKFWW